MTHDEHREPPDPQDHDEQDDFQFEIDPLDIAPYQHGGPGAGAAPPPEDDPGAPTYVPQIPVPPPAEPEPPEPDTVLPDDSVPLPRDDAPPAPPVQPATPALPISETFTGEVIMSSPVARGTTDDAGSPSGGEIPLPPPPPPPPPPAWGDDDLGELITPAGKRKRKHDPDYARSFTWLEAWVQAVTQPNPDAYEELIADPQASQSRAMRWIVVAYAVMFGVIFCGAVVFAGGGSADSLVGTLCVLPFLVAFVAVFAIVGFAIHFGVMHIVARILGGTGAFWEVFYLGLCYYIPLVIIGSVLSFIPCIGMLIGFALGLYALYLAVVAVRASHGLEWGRAAVAGLAWTLLGCGCACLMVLLLVAGGSASSDLQDLLDDLISPTPSWWWGLRALVGV